MAQSGSREGEALGSNTQSPLSHHLIYLRYITMGGPGLMSHVGGGR
jgi:hypothetical protein